MPLSEETKAKLAARAAGGASAPVAAPPPADDEPTRETISGPQESAATTPTPATVVGKMHGTPKRAKSAVGGSGSLAELAAALTASEAEHAEASAKLEAAKDAMRKALA